MIFVTVGTHEQPFNRLIQYMDRLKRDGIIKDEVVMQTGFSSYQPMWCEWAKLLSYREMVENVENARIVITHGGPASFIMPLQYGKIPIVVPRQKKFDEHINDHQVEFTKNVSDFKNIIIPIYDINELKTTIENYDYIVKKMNNMFESNNIRFNTKFDEIIRDMFS